MKTADVYSAVVDLLIDGQRDEWTVAELYRALTWHPAYDLNWGEYHVRRAIALLPAACVTRNGSRLFISPRSFVPTPELVAEVRRADDGMNVPLLLNDERRTELRRALVLRNNWALHKSLEWAAAGGAVEYGAGYGSMFVRAKSA